MRNIELIIIHCSATRCDRRFSLEDLIACHDARILGHRDLPGVSKACPCFDASEYQNI